MQLTLFWSVLDVTFTSFSVLAPRLRLFEAVADDTDCTIGVADDVVVDDDDDVNGTVVFCFVVCCCNWACL